MSSIEYKKIIKERMILTIDGIIAKKINTLEGIRELLKLRHELDLSDNEVFLPLIGIASETDEFPLGIARDHYDKSLLKRYDKELNDYLSISEETINDSCRNIKSKLK